MNEKEWRQANSFAADIFDSISEQDHLKFALLLEQATDVNLLNYVGNPLLSHSLTQNNIVAFDILLEKGADVNRVSTNGEYCVPLDFAIHAGIHYVEKLLRLGADPNYKDHNGTTSLHLAAMAGHWEMVELMVEYGANESSIMGKAWDDYQKHMTFINIG